MSAELVALLAFLGLLAAIGLRVPIGAALFGAGFLGTVALDGFPRAAVALAAVPKEMVNGYSFSVVPLFVLMGAIAARAGLSRELYEAARALGRGRGRGSLASATIGACALFGAICGSSVATAATMSRVSIPEMRRAGYADALSAGAVAAGGTLGILIPPSVVLVVYGLIAQQSLAALFAAALLPGILLTLFCILVVWGIVRLRPGWAPPAPASEEGRGRLARLGAAWQVLGIFALSLGGIYLGWFSVTEAAAVGAGATAAVALAGRRLSWRGLLAAIEESVLLSASLFFIFLGALVFARFVAVTRLPAMLAEWVAASGLPVLAVMALIVLFFLVLGCFLETMSMVLVTVPVLLPVVESLGFHPVWFGVLIVVVAEMGLITPPVGMNLFVIRAAEPGIPLSTIAYGSAFFLLAHLALVAVLVLAPGVAMWLPSQL
ncbi:MAG: TRAP transporter large permease subunit [Acetobacteraceae bacterium]|nr:TRAP transporter large permease subunit [Acetobacteraceae bacterium]